MRIFPTYFGLDAHFCINERKQQIKTIYTLYVDFFTLFYDSIEDSERKKMQKALIVEAMQ